MDQFPARKYVPEQKPGLRVAPHALWTDDARVQKQTTVFEQRINLPEVCAQAVTANVLKHSDGSDFVEPPRHGAVIHLFDHHAALQSLAAYGGPGEIKLA